MEPQQLPDAWDQGDDWRGITSAKERRRRQNRLHQRTHRKKRRVFGPPAPAQDASLRDARSNECHAIIGTHTELILELPTRSIAEARGKFGHSPMFLIIVQCMGLSSEVTDVLQKAFLHWSLQNPSLSHLPSITRLNAFDALIRNASILHIPVQDLESEDCSSPFSRNNQLASRNEDGLTFPSHLHPTLLQRTVAHHAWLDLFPFPELRNNLLHGIESGSYDEDHMANVFCCDLLNLEAKSTAPMIIWGDSWDSNGWEFSVEFLQRWEILFQGCPDIIQATNCWRRKRGETEIQLLSSQPTMQREFQ